MVRRQAEHQGELLAVKYLSERLQKRASSELKESQGCCGSIGGPRTGASLQCTAHAYGVRRSHQGSQQTSPDRRRGRRLQALCQEARLCREASRSQRERRRRAELSKSQRDRATAVYRPSSETAARGATGGAEETTGPLGMPCNAMQCNAMQCNARDGHQAGGRDGGMAGF